VLDMIQFSNMCDNKKCVCTYGTPIYFCDTLFHGTALTTIYEELLKLTGRL